MPEHSPRLLALAFFPFPSPSGAATRLAQRVTAFVRAGYALDVLTPKTADLPHVSKLLEARLLRVPMPSEVDDEGRPRPAGRVAPVSVQHGRSLRAAQYAAFERAVRRQLAFTDYDLVYTMDPYAAAMLGALPGGPPVVFEPQGLHAADEADDELLAELRRRTEALLCTAALVLMPSEAAAAWAREAGARSLGVEVLRPAADLLRFSPVATWPSATLMKIVLAAASLTSAEVALISRALLGVPAPHEVHLTISAEVSPADRARLTAHPGLRRRVELVPPELHEDLVPRYRAADVGLVVSAGGDGPLSVRLQAAAEMMACGLPTLLPDLPAAREIVPPGGDKLLVPPGDDAALALALGELAADSAARQALGEAARLHAAEFFDERHAATRLLALCGALLSPSIRIEDDVYQEASAGPEPTRPDASSGG